MAVPISAIENNVRWGTEGFGVRISGTFADKTRPMGNLSPVQLCFENCNRNRGWLLPHQGQIGTWSDSQGVVMSLIKPPRISAGSLSAEPGRDVGVVSGCTWTTW